MQRPDGLAARLSDDGGWRCCDPESRGGRWIGDAGRAKDRRLATWQFARITVDQSEDLLGEADGEAPGPPALTSPEWVASWEEALRLLDRYPWARLHPVAVHPEFVERVRVAVEERLAGEPQHRSVERERGKWERLLGRSGMQSPEGERLMAIMTVNQLEDFGRERLSKSFYMREFLYSEISQVHGIPNIPDDPELAIAAGKALCENVLEPIQDRLGRISVRSGFRSVAVNAKGAENQQPVQLCGGQLRVPHLGPERARIHGRDGVRRGDVVRAVLRAHQGLDGARVVDPRARAGVCGHGVLQEPRGIQHPLVRGSGLPEVHLDLRRESAHGRQEVAGAQRRARDRGTVRAVLRAVSRESRRHRQDSVMK